MPVYPGARPFAPLPLQELHHYYEPVRRRVGIGTQRLTVSAARRAPSRHRRPSQATDSSISTRLFAVGTARTGGPPHGSQRAELPHWAPTSGSSRRVGRQATGEARSAARVPVLPLGAHDPAHFAHHTRLCVRSAFCWPCSPRSAPFPPPPPRPVTRRCSAASQVLRGCQTSHPRSSQAYGFRLP